MTVATFYQNCNRQKKLFLTFADIADFSPPQILFFLLLVTFTFTHNARAHTHTQTPCTKHHSVSEIDERAFDEGELLQ